MKPLRFTKWSNHLVILFKFVPVQRKAPKMTQHTKITGSSFMHFNDLIISDNLFSAKCSIFSYCNLKTKNKEVTFLLIFLSIYFMRISLKLSGVFKKIRNWYKIRTFKKDFVCFHDSFPELCQAITSNVISKYHIGSNESHLTSNLSQNNWFQ